MVDSILVSVDFSNKNDTGVMVVGRKRMNCGNTWRRPDN